MPNKYLQNHFTIFLPMFAALSFLSGCMVETKRTDPWRDWAEYVGYDLDEKKKAKAKQDFQFQAPPGSRGYTIILKSFEGGSRFKKAQQLMSQVNHILGGGSCWIQENGDIYSVYRGRYYDESDPQAQTDLTSTQNLIMGGRRPFKDAELVEIGATQAKDAWDLRNHKGKYTLQIGFYDHAFGKDYRKAAENEVKKMRAQKLEAYYYHGPNMSLVTLGVYDHDKAFSIINHKPILNPKIRSLQQKFPHNLKNGKPFIDPRSQRPGPASSFLANVPEI